MMFKNGNSGDPTEENGAMAVATLRVGNATKSKTAVLAPAVPGIARNALEYSRNQFRIRVCNRKWFFGQKNNKDNTIKEKLEKKYSSPFLYKLTIFIILFLGIVGIINLLEEFLVSLNFQFKDFFELKNRIENKLFNFFINN